MSEPDITLAEVVAANRRIESLAVRTPLVPASGLDLPEGGSIWLKLEGVQPTGSFKIRGAASAIRALSASEAARGVVTASTGNHGRATAHVAGQLGVPVTVCVSEGVPPGKVAALRSLGCDLLVGGASQADALAAAAGLVAERGMTLVHPFDDRRVIAGQGTVGLEVLDQLLEVSTIVVPMSGGGLISGVALAAKSIHPDIEVVGVSMEKAPAMARSLREGRPVDLVEEVTLADSLQGGVGSGNRFTLALVRDLVDRVVLVGEQLIWEAMRFALDRHRLVLEGAGAVGIAAVQAGEIGGGGNVVVVCSGANAEPDQIVALARGSERPPEDEERDA